MSGKRRIKMNVWGNWNGYEGSKRALEFGTDERGARVWFEDPAQYQRELQESLSASIIIKHHEKSSS